MNWNVTGKTRPNQLEGRGYLNVNQESQKKLKIAKTDVFLTPAGVHGLVSRGSSCPYPEQMLVSVLALLGADYQSKDLRLYVLLLVSLGSRVGCESKERWLNTVARRSSSLHLLAHGRCSGYESMLAAKTTELPMKLFVTIRTTTAPRSYGELQVVWPV